MNSITKQQLIQLIQQDQGVTPEEKAELINKLENDELFEHLMHGAAGAGIGYIIAKYLKLSKEAQFLLSIAGFGIGRYILDKSKNDDRFLQYDSKLKVYNIK